MGVIVPDYMTKWGITAEAYISLAYKEYRVVPPSNTLDQNWGLFGEFGVYKDRLARLVNPADVLDKIYFALSVPAADIEATSTFDIIYQYLGTLYPNGVAENNTIVLPVVEPVVEPVVPSE